jgi:hypothetical protein
VSICCPTGSFQSWIFSTVSPSAVISVRSTWPPIPETNPGVPAAVPGRRAQRSFAGSRQQPAVANLVWLTREGPHYQTAGARHLIRLQRLASASNRDGLSLKVAMHAASGGTKAAIRNSLAYSPSTMPNSARNRSRRPNLFSKLAIPLRHFEAEFCLAPHCDRDAPQGFAPVLDQHPAAIHGTVSEESDAGGRRHRYESRDVCSFKRTKLGRAVPTRCRRTLKASGDYPPALRQASRKGPRSVPELCCPLALQRELLDGGSCIGGGGQDIVESASLCELV